MKIIIVILIAGFFLLNTIGVGYARTSDIKSELTVSGQSGVIDGIVAGEIIIINDCSFRLSEKTKYNRPGNLNCSGRWFKKHDRIYYILEFGTRTVKAIWLAGGEYKVTGTP